MRFLSVFALALLFACGPLAPVEGGSSSSSSTTSGESSTTTAVPTSGDSAFSSGAESTSSSSTGTSTTQAGSSTGDPPSLCEEFCQCPGGPGDADLPCDVECAAWQTFCPQEAEAYLACYNDQIACDPNADIFACTGLWNEGVLVCIISFCGDGMVQGQLGEECDDGGTLSGDGCGKFCQEEIQNRFDLKRHRFDLKRLWALWKLRG